jgi:hypothetical protein
VVVKSKLAKKKNKHKRPVRKHHKR